MSDVKTRLWDDFCARHSVLAGSAPLFDTAPDCTAVRTFAFGRDGRPLLRRSEQMDKLVIGEVEKVLRDYETGAGRYDGLIYLMFWTGHGEDGSERVLPLYVGKSEKYGRGDGNLSANIAGIRTNHGKFCRWGYHYAYHLGDLSAAVCPGHEPARLTQKYTRWAARLFDGCPGPAYPTTSPRLLRPVRFWVRAWGSGTDAGIWPEYRPTSLTFLEYLLIGVASDLFPHALLNSEGVNRG